MNTEQYLFENDINITSNNDIIDFGPLYKSAGFTSFINKKTLAMHLIETTKSSQFAPMPDADVTDEYGNTIAYYFVKYLHMLPPASYLPNPMHKNKSGETLAHMWCREIGTIPPESIMISPNAITNHGDILATCYVKKARSIPPLELIPRGNAFTDSMKYNLWETLIIVLQRKLPSMTIPQSWYPNPSYVPNFGDPTLAMIYIRFAKTIPPHYLMHSSLIRDIDGNTMLMYFAEFGQYDLIPKSMTHSSNMQNNQGKTASMIWMESRHTIPPAILHANPYIQDYKGKTQLMYFIEHTPRAENFADIPERFIHSLAIQDKNRHSVAHYCISNYNNIPSWICKGYFSEDVIHEQDSDGNTLAMYWILQTRRVNVPTFLLYNTQKFHILNKHGQSLLELIAAYT